MRGIWVRLLIAGLFVTALILGLYWWVGRDLSSQADARVFYLGGFLALLLAGIIGRGRTSFPSSWQRAFGQIVIWLAVALVILGGYAYRAEIRQIAGRILGELDPALGRSIAGPDDTAGSGTMLFTMADDGQFHVQATVDGTAVRFILDTGASEVMLSAADARRLGFDPANLSYTRSYQTANGQVMGAPVVLKSVDIGPIHMSDVAASVLENPSDMSLLGMSFLSRLKGYQVQGSNLILTQ
jgi:aspartyl protease family protein